MARLLALLAVLAAAWAWAYAAAPPCDEVAQMMMPCVASARYPQCCAGVTAALNAAASSRDDWVAVCNCLKSVAANFPGIDSSRAAKLPALCGVGIGISITVTPYIDCNG